MTRIVHAIRVQSSQFRREAPELEEAIAALDRAECVLVFPEGVLRRRADQLLRPFGRGVWHILHERPETPVMAAWIEGGWGSFFSWFGGPPMKNKRIDRLRPIRIALGEPQLLSRETLENHRQTRHDLRQMCLQAREYLGLEVLPEQQPPDDEPAPDE
jgi:1-acyl-sn-glycerol-3-phosphate acyltransferase